MSTPVAMKDFTKKRKPVEFLFSGVMYKCYPGLAPDSMQELMGLADGITHENAIPALSTFFRAVMNEANSEPLIGKLSDREDPLEIDVATNMMLWIMEQYGLRPTPSLPDSSTGSPTGNDGSPSEVGA